MELKNLVALRPFCLLFLLLTNSCGPRFELFEHGSYPFAAASFYHLEDSSQPKVSSTVGDCEVAIVGAIVFDNGEEDELPHGPFGSLHVVIRNETAKPISHIYLNGPTLAGPNKWEWLDGDSVLYSARVNTAQVSGLPVLPLICAGEGESRFVEVWESDPMLLGVNANWPRAHEMLFISGSAQFATIDSYTLVASPLNATNTVNRDTKYVQNPSLPRWLDSAQIESLRSQLEGEFGVVPKMLLILTRHRDLALDAALVRNPVETILALPRH